VSDIDEQAALNNDGRGKSKAEAFLACVMARDLGQTVIAADMIMSSRIYAKIA
jgi:hypothetical protein